MEKIYNWLADVYVVWSNISKLHYFEEKKGKNIVYKNELIKKINSHKANLEKRYNIQEWTSGYEFDFDMSCDITLGTRGILFHIEDKLLQTDKEGREFFIKSLSKKIYWMLEERHYKENVKVNQFFSKYENPDLNSKFIECYHYMIFYFLSQLYRMCSDLNFNLEDMLAYDIDQDFPESVEFLFWNSEVDPNHKAYKRLERTHAIATVNILLDKLEVYKDNKLDKTKIAEFVEAVTGGNINVKGKDTTSYKKPTQPAINAAKELLKKINL